MRFLVFLLGCSAVAFSQPVLRLKIPPPSRPALPNSSRTAAASMEIPQITTAGHWIVQFDDPPPAAAKAALRSRGAAILQEVPDNALLLSTGDALALDGLNARYAAKLEPRSKVSPLMEAVLAGLVNIQYIVEFHSDIDLNAARAMVLSTGLELRENPDLGPGRLLVLWRARLRGANPIWNLATRDEVAYIFPASPDLIRGAPLWRCASAVTETGGLAQYISTFGSGWDGAGLNATTLGYVFGAATAKLPADTAQAEITRAMATWSQVVKISWVQGTLGTATRTVNVLFGKGSHGDGFPFDGPGNVLAHTFYPAPPNPEPIGGDMHLDDDEAWRVGANIDLYSVALHELGHALGLGHSDDPAAVMYPYYRMASALTPADVAAIQTLYAAGPAATPTTPLTPTTPTTPTPPPPPPPPSDATAPTLTITSPSTSTLTTTAASRYIGGMAYDAVGLAQVTWSTNFGASGVASGTTNWSMTVPLLVGNNTITVRARDLAGNTAWRSVVVVRK